jgi:hypothetical protein
VERLEALDLQEPLVNQGHQDPKDRLVNLEQMVSRVNQDQLDLQVAPVA